MLIRLRFGYYCKHYCHIFRMNSMKKPKKDLNKTLRPPETLFSKGISFMCFGYLKLPLLDGLSRTLILNPPQVFWI